MRRANEWLAIQLTRLVGTMWCAYVFVGLAVLGIPYGSRSLPDYVQWLSQTLIQLVMLSVIMVGQRLISDQQAAHGERLNAVHRHLGIDETDDQMGRENDL
jgi:hypothetical protein